ncbi:hypothetical protein JVU11DRAFT_10150 [Chiua virens]|nr:hypothetical protein JVU11DRAFT_10150 [Chiua virens]
MTTIYDRMFIRVTPYPPTNNNTTLAIYVMGRRSTRHGDMRHLERHPSVVLEFGSGPSFGLGTIHFVKPPASSVSIPMNNYLRKTAVVWGVSHVVSCLRVTRLTWSSPRRSLSRKFKACDGQEYRWQHRTIDGHEWSCLSEDNKVIAHYDLRPHNVPAYSVSGNTLTIHEAYSHLYMGTFVILVTYTPGVG